MFIPYLLKSQSPSVETSSDLSEWCTNLWFEWHQISSLGRKQVRLSLLPGAEHSFVPSSDLPEAPIVVLSLESSSFHSFIQSLLPSPLPISEQH